MASREIGAVEVRGVRKTFAALEGSDVLALDGISLHVPTGEFTGIVGPSGSGLLIAEARVLEGVLMPHVIAVQCMPKVAIAPLLVIWFGFGSTSKTLLAFIMSFFHVVLALLRRKLLFWTDTSERAVV